MKQALNVDTITTPAWFYRTKPNCDHIPKKTHFKLIFGLDYFVVSSVQINSMCTEELI